MGLQKIGAPSLRNQAGRPSMLSGCGMEFVKNLLTCQSEIYSDSMGLEGFLRRGDEQLRLVKMVSEGVDRKSVV